METLPELFSSTDMACESPRARWMRENAVTTFDRGSGGEDEFGEYQRWHATGFGKKADGDTQDEALAELAKKAGVRFWNEVGL